MTRFPSVQPMRVWPSGSRMAVKGMLGVETSQTTSPSGVYSRHDLVEQLGHEVMAVGQLASHAGLEVVVAGLGLEGISRTILP